jgi:hypothetical protein
MISTGHCASGIQWLAVIARLIAGYQTIARRIAARWTWFGVGLKGIFIGPPKFFRIATETPPFKNFLRLTFQLLPFKIQFRINLHFDFDHGFTRRVWRSLRAWFPLSSIGTFFSQGWLALAALSSQA